MKATELLDPASPKLRSRIHGHRRVLKELRRILIKAARANEFRATTDDERRWGARVGDTLKSLVDEGDKVLPGYEDPRDRRRVRKRPLKLL